MRSVKFTFLTLFFLALTALAWGVPQQGGTPPATVPAVKAVERVAAPPTVPVTINPPFPFKVGEALTFNFSFSRFPLFGQVGELNLTVVEPEHKTDAPAADPVPMIAFRAVAESKGFFPSLLGFKVRDVFYSASDSRDLGALYGQKDVDEGKKKFGQINIYDRPAGKVTITETNRAVTPQTAKSQTTDNRFWTTDLVSFWYVLRTQPLEKGKVIPMVLTDDGKSYDIEVVVLDSEKIEVPAGKFKARRLQIKAYEGKFVRREGEFFYWISEDAARLPLKVRFKTSGATVTGELTKFRRPTAISPAH